jgi:hypothetical protein
LPLLSTFVPARKESAQSKKGRPNRENQPTNSHNAPANSQTATKVSLHMQECFEKQNEGTCSCERSRGKVLRNAAPRLSPCVGVIRPQEYAETHKAISGSRKGIARQQNASVLSAPDSPRLGPNELWSCATCCTQYAS